MTKVQWTIAPASPADRPAIIDLTRAAFTRDGRDGAEEVRIVQDTWTHEAALPGLELVAVALGKTVGHVLGAKGDLGGRAVPGIAPLSVAPGFQRQGVGSALMTELIRRAEDQGWPLIALLGNPAYYGRFGFEAAGALGIVYPPVGPDNPDFMVRRLRSFDPSLRGKFTYCWEAP